MRRSVRTLPCVLAAVLLSAWPAFAEDGPRLGEGVGSQDYNAAGRGLNAGLGALKEAFKHGCPPEALRAVLASDFSGEVRALREEELRSADGVHVLRLRRGEVLGRDGEAAVALWASRHAAFVTLEGVAFKVLFVDRVEPGGRVHARFRSELVGEDAQGRSRVERASWSSVWTKDGDGYRLFSFELTAGEVVLGPGDLFRECAEEKGLQSFGVEDSRYSPPSDPLRYQVIRHAIGGAAAADVNGDGWDDVLLTTGESIALFLNDGGTFRHATVEAGLSGVTHVNAPLFADFDADGDQDLYLGRFYGHNLLFENTGGGKFQDRTEGSGFAQDDMTAVLAAGDFNGDGHLDLYLGRFLDARTEVPDMILYTRNGAPNRMYFGRGDLTFEDVSARSGADDVGLTLGVGAADYDRDGDQDLYLSNDYGRNVLLRNRGDGTFEDATLETNTLAISGGMSVSWGDVDNDGRLDLYVSSIASNQRWFSQDLNIRSYVLNIVQSARRERLQSLFLDLRKHMGDDWDQVGNTSLAGNYLLCQTEAGKFKDLSERWGARPKGWYWSSGFFDVDNDGNLDVFAVDGWITGKKTDDL